MTLTVGRLQGVLSLDDKPFRQGIGQARGQMGTLARDTKSSAGGMRNSLLGVGATIAAAFTARTVVRFGGEMQSTAGRVAAANRQMDFSFEGSAKRVREWGAEWANQIGLTESEMDSLTAGLGSLLRQIGFGADEAADMTLEFGELAIALGNAKPELGGAQHAAEALGGALVGERERLKAYGLSIQQADIDARLAQQGLQGLTGEALKQAEAQATLQIATEQTGGSLEDLRQNGIDPNIRSQNELRAAIKETKESLANVLAPAISFAGGLLTTALEHPAGQASVVVGGLGLAFLGMLPFISRVRQALIDLNIAQHVAQFGSLRGAITKIAIPAAVIFGLVQLESRLRGIQASFGEIDPSILIGDFDNLTNEIRRFNRTGEVGRELWSIIGDDFSNLSRFVRDSSDAYTELDEGLSTLMANRPDEAIQFLAEANRQVDGSLRDILDVLPDTDAAVQSLKEDAAAAGIEVGSLDELLQFLAEHSPQAAEGVNESADAGRNVAEGFQQAADAIDAYTERLQASIDPLFGALEANDKLAEARRNVRDAEREVMLAAAGSEDATMTLEEAQRNLGEAQDEVTEAAFNQQFALLELEKGIRDGSVQIDEAKDALDRFVDSGALTREEADRMVLKFLAVAGSAEEAEGPWTVEILEEGAPATMAQIKRVTGLGQILDAIDPTVSMRADDRASAAIRRVNDLLSALDGRSATTTIWANVRGLAALERTNQLLRAVGGRQHGGPVAGGRLYEVAEGDRAELLEMGGRTYLIPGSSGMVKAASRLGSGGGGGAALLGDIVDPLVAAIDKARADVESAVAENTWHTVSAMREINSSILFAAHKINRTIVHATNLITGRGPGAENWADPITAWAKPLAGFQHGGSVDRTGPGMLHAGEYVLSRQNIKELLMNRADDRIVDAIARDTWHVVDALRKVESSVLFAGHTINRTIVHATNLITGRGPGAENWANPITAWSKALALRSHSGELIPGGAEHETLRVLQGGETVFARNDPVSLAARGHQVGGAVPSGGALMGGDVNIGPVNIVLPPGVDERRAEAIGRAAGHGFTERLTAQRIRLMSRVS